jgi:hypothetical protein
MLIGSSVVCGARVVPSCGDGAAQRMMQSRGGRLGVGGGGGRCGRGRSRAGDLPRRGGVGAAEAAEQAGDTGGVGWPRPVLAARQEDGDTGHVPFGGQPGGTVELEWQLQSAFVVQRAGHVRAARGGHVRGQRPHAGQGHRRCGDLLAGRDRGEGEGVGRRAFPGASQQVSLPCPGGGHPGQCRGRRRWRCGWRGGAGGCRTGREEGRGLRGGAPGGGVQRGSGVRHERTGAGRSAMGSRRRDAAQRCLVGIIRQGRRGGDGCRTGPVWDRVALREGPGWGLEGGLVPTSWCPRGDLNPHAR